MGSNFNYIKNDDGMVIIMGYTGSCTDIIIPSEIDGKRVIAIGDWAFDGCNSLTSVTIPDSVVYIGWKAFENCIKLKSKIRNYKAFKIVNNQIQSQYCTFSENKWSEKIKDIEFCKSGYHFCTNLFEIFNYYSGEIDNDIVIYECEIGDKVIRSDTSKCVTNKIKPVKRLSRLDIIKILNGEK